MGYQLFDSKTRDVVASKDVVFDETHVPEGVPTQHPRIEDSSQLGDLDDSWP